MSAPGPETAPSSFSPSAPVAAGESGGLVVIEAGAAYQIPVRKNEVIADGGVIFKNTAATPVRITEVRLHFSEGGDKGLEIAGMKVLPIDSPDETVGIQRNFPPSSAVSGRWVDAVQAGIRPEAFQAAYELIIGFKISSGRHTVSKVIVTYQGNDSAEQVEWRHDITLCRQSSPSATTC